MKAYDMIKKLDVDVTSKSLIDLMLHDRQVDLEFSATLTDSDGYLSWDRENWTSIDGKRFIRCYMLGSRVLRDSTTHNIYAMANDFFPDRASKIEIN